MDTKGVEDTCTAVILHCIDFRLGSAIKKYLEDEDLLDDCDIVSIAGATKNISDPTVPTDKSFALGQIRASHRLHRIQRVILMNHTRCGAYGNQDSRERHIADMTAAKGEILSMFAGADPPVTVVLRLANIDEHGNVTIEDILG